AGTVQLDSIFGTLALRKQFSRLTGQRRARNLHLPEVYAEKVLLQLRVLCLGLLQDGDVRVGILPEGEEIFVGRKRPNAGGIGVGSLRGSRLQGIGTSDTQMRQCSCPTVPDD